MGREWVAGVLLALGLACGGFDGGAVAAPGEVAAPVAPAGPGGIWSGDVAGTPATLTLTVDGDRVRGPLDVGGYVYDVDARLSGGSVAGQLVDKQMGGALPLGGDLAGDRLTLRITGMPPLSFTRGGSATAPPAAAPAAGAAPASPAAAGPGTLDPALVGAWGRSESLGDGLTGGGVITEFLVVNGDGTWQRGSGPMAVGGAGWGGQMGGSEVTAKGRWSVQGNILHIDEGYGFQPYARVYIEGAKMMFTFANGSREVWTRR